MSFRKNKKLKRLKKAVQAPSLQRPLVQVEQIPALLETIQMKLLKNCTRAYVVSAFDLTRDLRLPAVDGHIASFDKQIAYLGKNARRLDLVMAIAGTSSFLSSKDREIVEGICRAIALSLVPYVTSAREGVLTIKTPSESVNVDTYSRFGRSMARWLALFVAPTTQERTQHTTQLNEPAER
jgi:hypothetical protein